MEFLQGSSRPGGEVRERLVEAGIGEEMPQAGVEITAVVVGPALDCHGNLFEGVKMPSGILVAPRVIGNDFQAPPEQRR